MKDTTEEHKEVSNGLAWSGFELQFSKSTKILDFWKYVKLKEKFHLNLSFGSESHTNMAAYCCWFKEIKFANENNWVHLNINGSFRLT